MLVWSTSGDESALVRAIRSPHSGVPHDVAAAYATIAARSGPLLDAIARDRLALPFDERAAVFAFAQHAHALRALAEQPDTQSVRAHVIERFSIREPGEHAQSIPFTNDALAFASAEEVEAPRGVRARQTHFSASSLNAYADCARKWYYRYVCGAVEDRGSSASTYGTAFHAALEDFHGTFARPTPDDEAEMRERIIEDVTWAFERFRADFGSALEVELHKRRAQRTAQRYIDWILAEARRAPFTVIGRELPINLDLDGFSFIGFIDRLDREDRTGAIAIFDYKTGTIATSANEYREKVARFADFQLPLYYWARTAQGDRVSRLALIPLKDALLDVEPIALEIVTVASAPAGRKETARGTISIAELERARTRMIEICRELTAGTIERFAVTNDASACRYCAYVNACARRPHGERERFGR